MTLSCPSKGDGNVGALLTLLNEKKSRCCMNILTHRNVLLEQQQKKPTADILPTMVSFKKYGTICRKMNKFLSVSQKARSSVEPA